MNIGLVAHDSKKKLMQNFCIAYRGIGHKTCGYAQIDKGLKAYKCSHATAYELSACVLCLPCYKYTLYYDKKQKNYYTDCTNKAKLLSGNSKGTLSGL